MRTRIAERAPFTCRAGNALGLERIRGPDTPTQPPVEARFCISFSENDRQDKQNQEQENDCFPKDGRQPDIGGRNQARFASCC
jgi:hypothetical protein